MAFAPVTLEIRIEDKVSVEVGVSFCPPIHG